MTKKIGIIQPGRLGDIITLLPAMHNLHWNGNHVIWPIFEEYIWMFTEVVDYVTFVPIKNNVQTAVMDSYNLLRNVYKVDVIDDIAATFPDSKATEAYVRCGDGWKETFDAFKYRTLGLDIDTKWNLEKCIKRNIEKEEKLYYDLVKSSTYAVAHLTSSKGKLDIKFDIPFGQLIDVTPDHNIFHWIKILKDAHTIICVNSSILNLVEGLNIDGRRKILFKVPDGRLPALKTKWEIM